MVYYPLHTLIKSGIEEIMVITGPEHCGLFLQYLGDGSEFGVDITYKAQMKPTGISHAVAMSKDFLRDEPFAVCLGDNFFQNNFKAEVASFKNGASIFVREVDNPQQFGVAVLDSKSKVISIEEKPKQPKSNLAVTGFYLYDSQFFDIFKELTPSARGEYEITDVNNWYIEHGLMDSHIIDSFWCDLGSYQSIVKTASYIASNKT
jgi:glucose-1-phosphate thymidylyltransferase